MNRQEQPTIVKGRDGSYAAKFSSHAFVPRWVCASAAGLDAWMRVIKFPCEGCDIEISAERLENSDLPGHCDQCAADYFCPHGVHPEDPCAECGNE